MKIADRELGPEHPVFLVGEVGVTSNGDVARGKALIDALADAGADAAKFILTDPDKIMDRKWGPTFEFLSWSPEFNDYARTVTDIYPLLKETMFTPDEWRQLRDHARARGLIFFLTVDHLDGVDFAETLDVPAYKVSAWDIAWRPLIARLRATGKPVLVDVGTATREEVAAAIPERPDVMFVHAPHPTAHGDWLMSRFARFVRADSPVGFSSPGRESWPDFVALGGGACLLEKRLTLRRDEVRGHHHAVSLEPDEFAQWVRDIRRAEAALREDPFGGSAEAWAERRKWDRDERGLRR